MKLFACIAIAVVAAISFCVPVAPPSGTGLIAKSEKVSIDSHPYRAPHWI